MHKHVVVESAHFQPLLDALAQRGYQVVGPTVRDGGIVYEEIDSVDELQRFLGLIRDAVAAHHPGQGAGMNP
jgi:hypothetical protein